jgi:hypothetical protein
MPGAWLFTVWWRLCVSYLLLHSVAHAQQYAFTMLNLKELPDNTTIPSGTPFNVTWVTNRTITNTVLGVRGVGQVENVPDQVCMSINLFLPFSFHLVRFEQPGRNMVLTHAMNAVPGVSYANVTRLFQMEFAPRLNGIQVTVFLYDRDFPIVIYAQNQATSNYINVVNTTQQRTLPDALNRTIIIASSSTSSILTSATQSTAPSSTSSGAASPPQQHPLAVASLQVRKLALVLESHWVPFLSRVCFG